MAKQLGSTWSDFYNEATAEAGTLANEVESGARWLGNAFVTANILPGLEGINEVGDAYNYATGANKPPGSIAGQVVQGAGNAVSGAVSGAIGDVESGIMTTMLVIGAIGLIAFGILEHK